jgi:hypothetical protein
MALDGHEAKDLAFPDARCETVHKRAYVGLRIFGINPARLELNVSERLDPACHNQHLIDSKPGIDGSKALIEEPCEMNRVA